MPLLRACKVAEGNGTLTGAKVANCKRAFADAAQFGAASQRANDLHELLYGPWSVSASPPWWPASWDGQSRDGSWSRSTYAVDEASGAARASQVVIEADLSAAPTLGDRVLVERLAANLVDNDHPPAPSRALG